MPITPPPTAPPPPHPPPHTPSTNSWKLEDAIITLRQIRLCLLLLLLGVIKTTDKRKAKAFSLKRNNHPINNKEAEMCGKLKTKEHCRERSREQKCYFPFFNYISAYRPSPPPPPPPPFFFFFFFFVSSKQFTFRQIVLCSFWGELRKVMFADEM